MPLQNTSKAYGSVTKTFHWLTFLLILTIIALGLVATQGSDAINDGAEGINGDYIARIALYFSLHKTLGLALFLVALARLIWAASQPRPGLLNTNHRLEVFAAEIVHLSLYISLVITPLSGWIHHAATQGFAPIFWPFGQDLIFVPKSDLVANISGGVHYIAQWVMIGTILLHVGAAFKHHLFDRDATLVRMLPGRRKDLPEPPTPIRSPIPVVAALLLWVGIIGAGYSIAQSPASGGAEGGAEALSTKLTERPSSWQVQEGTIALNLVQYGRQLEGSFSDWSAVINFTEPAKPGPAGDVDVLININSLTLGSVTRNALGTDYFDAQTYPTARFTAKLFKKDTDYEAQGTLTLRDKSVDLSFPFVLELQGENTKMSAQLTLQRLDFDVGLKDPTDKTLSLDVNVVIDLVAKEQEATAEGS